MGQIRHVQRQGRLTQGTMRPGGRPSLRDGNAHCRSGRLRPQGPSYTALRAEPAKWRPALSPEAVARPHRPSPRLAGRRRKPPDGRTRPWNWCNSPGQACRAAASRGSESRTLRTARGRSTNRLLIKAAKPTSETFPRNRTRRPPGGFAIRWSSVSEIIQPSFPAHHSSMSGGSSVVFWNQSNRKPAFFRGSIVETTRPIRSDLATCSAMAMGLHAQARPRWSDDDPLLVQRREPGRVGFCRVRNREHHGPRRAMFSVKPIPKSSRGRRL